MARRLPAPLLPMLLLCACASTDPPFPDPEPPPGAAAAAGDPAAAFRTPTGATPPAADAPDASDASEQGLFYTRIADLASRWAVLQSEPGEAARAHALALETAIARDVVRRMDAVLRQAEQGVNPRWRRAAARGLGFVSDGRARPVLEGLLGESDVRLLVDVLVSLARRAAVDTSAAAEDRLVLLVGHGDADVRSNAALCLARVFRARARLGMPVMEPADRIPVAEAVILGALFDPADPIVRGNAAQALGVLGGPACEDALQNGLRETDLFVRLSCVQALARSGSGRSVAPILDAMAVARETAMRQASALALGAIAEREGRRPPLADLGTDAAKWRAWFAR